MKFGRFSSFNASELVIHDTETNIILLPVFNNLNRLPTFFIWQLYTSKILDSRRKFSWYSTLNYDFRFSTSIPFRMKLDGRLIQKFSIILINYIMQDIKRQTVTIVASEQNAPKIKHRSMGLHFNVSHRLHYFILREWNGGGGKVQVYNFDIIQLTHVRSIRIIIQFFSRWW